jgi:heat shock protein HslJ
MTRTLPACTIAALAALALATPAATAAERTPVLEYVKPGVEVTFVSALDPPSQDVDGMGFLIERWSDYTFEEIHDVERRAQQIKLAFSGGRLTGFGPCNTIGASYTLEGGVMRIGPVTRSKKMCPEPGVVEMEDRLVRFLERVNAMERIGIKLVLRTEDGGQMSLWGTPLDLESGNPGG